MSGKKATGAVCTGMGRWAVGRATPVGSASAEDSMPTKPKPKKRQPSKLEGLLATQIKALKLPEPEREFRF